MKNVLNLQLFAQTSVSDLVIPEVYTAYMNEKSPVLSRLLNSGIAVTDPKMQELANGAGTTINVPFLKDLDGDDEVIVEGVAMTPAKMTADKQIGVRLIRGKGWSWTDLSQILSQADPVTYFYDRVAAYWERQEQKTMISIINGLFTTSGALASTHLNDISAVASGGVIDSDAILDTKQLLGDADVKLTYIAMHSATHTLLQKLNLIDYIPDSDGNVAFERYLGYNVIVDDGLPVDTGTYTTILFGEGAFAYGYGMPNGLVPIENDREAAKSADNIFTRRSLVLHPQGLKFTSASVAAETPTNAELATATNWAKVMADKNISIVALKHKLVANAAE